MKNVISIAAVVLSTISTQYAFAEWDGPALVPSEAWQDTLELGLSIPFSARAVEEHMLHQPFFVPQAKSHGLTTYRNQSVRLTLDAKHLSKNGEPDRNLDWSIKEYPRHGQISGSVPHLVYTPNSDYTGFDELVFEVRDTEGNKTQGTIDIKVNGAYTLFESGQVRPLAMNTRGDRLYALNTPDGKLEVFDLSSDFPRYLGGINVGLEPVSISLRNDDEAWVVNTLSDSVSVVDLRNDALKITRTLHVGDEPQDIVFAGSNKSKAFITTARRGQHSPSGIEAMTPSVGRADVWVFNANSAAVSPEKIVNLYGMAPRALATSPDGTKVYVAIFKSGNKSTIAAPNFKLFGENATIAKPGPKTDAMDVEGPNTGVIVKHDGTNWRDLFGTNWDSAIYFDLPDYDVFELNADNPDVGTVKRHSGVGNALFNLAVNPVSGNLYVSNMEARNELLFEGHGERAHVQTLRGRFIRNQISVIDQAGEVTQHDLNPHLDDSRPDGSASDNAKSLAMPLEMVIDSSGNDLYVAAFSSSKVGVFDIDALESGSFTVSENNHIEVSGGGPSGLLLDEARGRLYALTRFNNSIAVIDTETRREVSSVPMYNPEPEVIVSGRPFLYDARFSSGRGDSSCASCHLFGDIDGIAWELGEPDGKTTENPIPYANRLISFPALRIHHPLKGPMLTQSLRGLEFQGGMHWRGDRPGKEQVGGESQERAAFKEFRGAFTGLLAKDKKPSIEQMNAFTDFVMQMRYPPNPNRNLDDTLTPKAQIGADIYFNEKTTGFISSEDRLQITCNDCHEVDSDIERFGTNTLMSFEGVEHDQDMKVPHLRNVYTRIGMFGQVVRPEDNTSTGRHMGDQVTGYGLSHDGALDTMETFLSMDIFHIEEGTDDEIFEYVTQIPTGLAPIVGQQATLTPQQQSQNDIVNLMMTQAAAHLSPDGPNKQQCDLIAWGMVDGVHHSWMLDARTDQFRSDRNELVYLDQLRAYSTESNNSITFMCAPPGSGHRIALDRDEDGVLNSDDTVISGLRPFSVSPANPFEATRYLKIDRSNSDFEREQKQRSQGTFPDFTGFFNLTLGGIVAELSGDRTPDDYFEHSETTQNEAVDNSGIPEYISPVITVVSASQGAIGNPPATENTNGAINVTSEQGQIEATVNTSNGDNTTTINTDQGLDTSSSMLSNPETPIQSAEIGTGSFGLISIVALLLNLAAIRRRFGKNHSKHYF